MAEKEHGDVISEMVDPQFIMREMKNLLNDEDLASDKKATILRTMATVYTNFKNELLGEENKYRAYTMEELAKELRDLAGRLFQNDVVGEIIEDVLKAPKPKKAIKQAKIRVKDLVRGTEEAGLKEETLLPPEEKSSNS